MVDTVFHYNIPATVENGCVYGSATKQQGALVI